MAEITDKTNAIPVKRPRLSFWQIWNMSFGFLGIQFGFALQNANVSRIFQYLNADIDDIPILWIAAPVTGLIVQPIVGHFSDRTWNRLGRRRPYFLAGAILASSALFIMPNSPVLWVAAGMLWIMDASINISMEPFRAFVGDMLSSDQRTAGFAMQSFFIGTGAVIASALPYSLDHWFHISNIVEGNESVPQTVKLSFYIGGVVFFLSVLWTVIKTKEYSPEDLLKFTKAENPDYKPASEVPPLPGLVFLKNSVFWILAGGVLSGVVYFNNWDKELYILSMGILFFGIIQIVTGHLTRMGRHKSGFIEVMNDLFKMPVTMKQLAWVQFFSWFALFSMWIYTTPAVTNHIYGTSDTTSAIYNEGANWVGISFAVYNGVAALVAFLLPPMAKFTNRKTVHAIALTLGGLALVSIFFINDPKFLLVSMVGIGIAWASILSMPYAILAGALPIEKMGIYMGIFNFFIVIPQIIAASILGFLVRNFYGGDSVFALVTGGVCMGIAAIMVLRVKDVDD